MHHSDQLYLFRSTRLLYPSDLIVFSKCQEQMNRSHRPTSHLATMRPNAKHGENVMHGYGFFALRVFLGEIFQALKSLWFPLNDIVMLFVPQCSLWWSSNYTGPRNGKANSGRTPLHPSMRYHITPWYHCGLRLQAESNTVINLVGFDSMKWE